MEKGDTCVFYDELAGGHQFAKIKEIGEHCSTVISFCGKHTEKVANFALKKPTKQQKTKLDKLLS